MRLPVSSREPDIVPSARQTTTAESRAATISLLPSPSRSATAGDPSQPSSPPLSSSSIIVGAAVCACPAPATGVQEAGGGTIGPLPPLPPLPVRLSPPPEHAPTVKVSPSTEASLRTRPM